MVRLELEGAQAGIPRRKVFCLFWSRRLGPKAQATVVSLKTSSHQSHSGTGEGYAGEGYAAAFSESGQCASSSNPTTAAVCLRQHTR